jgi:hypothetical protein
MVYFLADNQGAATIERKPEIVTLCGWCPNVRERTLAVVQAGDHPSHTMCPACAKRMNDELDAKERTNE